jgi:hypothetical protein
MSTSSNPDRERMLRMCPLPQSAVDLFAADEPELLSTNRWLTGAQRVAWLSTAKLPANVAANAAAFEFSPDELCELLARERRTSVIEMTMTFASLPALCAVITQRPSVPAAESAARMLEIRDHRHPLLLEHLDLLHGATLLGLLDSTAPDVLCDARVAAVMIAEGPAWRGSWLIDVRLTSLLMERPGLLGELCAAPLAPKVAFAAAHTPWVDERSAAAIRAVDADPDDRERIVAAVDANPWAPGADGSAPQVTGAPAELCGDELRVAWNYASASLKPTSSPRHRLALLFVENPELGPLRRAVRDHMCALFDERSSWSVTERMPEWRRDTFGAASVRNLDWAPPKAAPAFQRPDRRWPTFAEATAAHDVPDDEVERHFTDPGFVHRKLPVDVADAVWARFADALGDDVDAWRTAALLIDSVNGSLAELVELASVTLAQP